MKINEISYTNLINFKSNICLGDECLKVHKNKNGDEFIRCNIYEKNYNIKLTDESRDIAELNKLVENIKKSKSGFFIRYGKHEYFIPYILKKPPEILKHIHTVENGNSPLELSEASVNAKDVIEAHVKRKVNVRYLKAIRYLKRTVDGFDGNTIVKTAYSYFDKKMNDLYLYIPEKKIMQVLFNNEFVKKIHL